MRRQGCIIKRGGTYSVVIDLGKDPGTGRRKRKWQSGFRTKREAESYLAEALAQLSRGTYVEPARMTVAEFLAKWLDHAAPKLAPRTLEGYRLNVNRHIVPHIGQLELSKLRPLHVQEMYDQLLAQGLAPKTVLYVHRVLHRALEVAVKWQLVGRNVCDAVEAPRAEAEERPTLAPEQAQALLAGITDLRLLVPVTLALSTGMRRGEICGLRWQDVDLEAGRAYVVQTVQRLKGQGLTTLPTKTRGSRRAVDLPEAAVAVLKAWRKRQLEERLAAGPFWQETGFVCTAPDGRPLDPGWITHAFGKAVRALGLPPVTFHDLRHTHASLLLKLGVPAKVIQQRLGHSSIGTTMNIYVHADQDLQKEAALKIDGLLRAAIRTRGWA